VIGGARIFHGGRDFDLVVIPEESFPIYGCGRWSLSLEQIERERDLRNKNINENVFICFIDYYAFF
jgi:hypothetical protein